MAESRLAQDLQANFLQCAICMEGYKSPRMLPCIHSFCLRCLQRLEQHMSQQLSCPTCRRVVNLPENGVKGLPNNFLLVSLMERINLTDTVGSATASCNFCQGGHDIQLCLDCKFYICSTCIKFHDKIPDTDDHTRILFEKCADKKYMEKILATQSPRCSEHRKEKLRFYCTPCGELVCLHCTIISHRGHECIEAEKRWYNAKEELKNALKKSECQMKSVRQISANVIEETTIVKKNVRDVKREVEERFDKFVERLKSDKDKLIQKIEKLEKQRCDPLKKKEDDVRNWTEAMKNTQTVTNMLLEGDNQWEILKMEGNIIHAFNKFFMDEDNLQRRQLNKYKSNVIMFSLPFESKSPDELQISLSSDSNVLGGVTEFGGFFTNFFYTSTSFKPLN